jgi:hypothetical protein
MATDSGYERGNYLRVCDICGHRFHFRDLTPIGELRFACSDDATGLTAMQISRFNARAKPLVVKPNRWAKDYVQVPIYQLAEAQIFNLVASVAPAEAKGGASSPMSAAWGAIYMADVLAQGKRPTQWDRTARTTLTTCLTYLLSVQVGSPSGLLPSLASTDVRYGGVAGSGTFLNSEFSTYVFRTDYTIAAGVAFIKAYGVTGNRDYLAAARRAATFLRHVQCGDKISAGYTVFPAGGGRYHSGGLAAQVQDNLDSGVISANYNTADVGGLWFLRLLADVDGESAVFGGAASGMFTQATSATLATMMSELTEFASVGPRDSTQASAHVPALSATSAHEVYQAATHLGSGTGAWVSASTISSDSHCLAILGLYIANGATAKVTEMLAWLQGFSSNAANRTPAGEPDYITIQGITGTYDPTVAPADYLTSASPFTEAVQGLYSWASLGLLSPILSTTAPTRFTASKDKLFVPRRFSLSDVSTLYLGPIGTSGLEYQPKSRTLEGGGMSGTNASNLVGISSSVSVPPTSPATTGLVLWLRADRGVTTAGGVVTRWEDQSGYGQHMTVVAAGHEPTYTAASTNDLPALTFGLTKYIERAAALVDRNGNPMDGNKARSIFVVCRPSTNGTRIGGPLLSFRRSQGTGCYAMYLLRLATLGGHTPALVIHDWWPEWASPLYDLSGTDYTNTPLLVEDRYSQPNLSRYINGAAVTQSGTDIGVGDGAGSDAVFTVGNIGGFTAYGVGWLGDISDIMVYDYLLTPGADETRTRDYVAGRYGSSSARFGSFGNVTMAAKTGMIYRYNPGRYPALRGA